MQFPQIPWIFADRIHAGLFIFLRANLRVRSASSVGKDYKRLQSKVTGYHTTAGFSSYTFAVCLTKKNYYEKFKKQCAAHRTIG